MIEHKLISFWSNSRDFLLTNGRINRIEIFHEYWIEINNCLQEYNGSAQRHSKIRIFHFTD